MANQGREFIENRVYRNKSQTDFLNDQSRILHVVITEEWLARQHYSLKQDDILQLKLIWNGSQSRNYRLKPNGKKAYETALQIPESATDIKAQVLINYEKKLYSFGKIKVNIEGRHLKVDILTPLLK